ncbi:MAG TPA: HNH endonuclease signature motif containing protein [Acidimicrobiales bacterium]|nr:HNH endonuclease signature motif containing protein [Acidimicrobiales bacterium]
MYPRLAEAIETLEVPLERDAIVTVLGLRDRLEGRIAAVLGEFQAAGLHELDGSVTMAAWLRHRTHLDGETAGRCARRAQKLHRLPVLREALIGGLLAGGVVDIVLAHVRKRHVALFAEHEAELVPRLVGLDVDAVTKAMRLWRARADALDPGPAPAEKPDTIHLSPTLDDRGVLNGSLGSDLFNLLSTALRVADPGDFELPLAQRRALALGQVCQTFLDFNPAAPNRRHRPHLNVSMTYEQWAAHALAPPAVYVETGMPVSRYGLDVLRCDANWHDLRYTDRATILRYGRAMRTWPADLFNAIAIRDGGCRWPGCTAPVHWCDVHHVEFWEHGGATDIDNGLLLCRRHHHKLHSKAGWHLKLLPDATVELTHPDGTTETSHPRGLHPPPRLPIPDA